MANWISRDEDLRKHETRKKLSFRTQKLFSIIKRIYRKISRSKPATVSSTGNTIKVLKDCQIELEQRKSEAFAHIYDYAWAYTQKLAVI